MIAGVRRNPHRARCQPGKLRGSKAFVAAKPSRRGLFKQKVGDAPIPYSDSKVAFAAAKCLEEQGDFLMKHALCAPTKLENGTHFQIGDKWEAGTVFSQRNSVIVPQSVMACPYINLY